MLTSGIRNSARGVAMWGCVLSMLIGIFGCGDLALELGFGNFDPRTPAFEFCFEVVSSSFGDGTLVWKC